MAEEINLSKNPQLDTKNKILDAAEKLIMELGAEKASLRKITEEAGVNIAAINYHFGSKNNLLSAIMARFLNPLMEELLYGLQELMAENAPALPPLKSIIRCHLIPMLNFSIKYPDYERIFSRLHLSYDDENIFKNQIKEITEKTTKYYSRCLIKVLPEIPEKTVLKRFAIFKNMSTAIMYGDCLMDESLDVLGLDPDREELVEEMVKMAATVFRA